MQKTDLRIVFMGTPSIAVASLNAIIKSGFNVVGVITAPDRPAGRGRKLQQSHVKEFAITRDIPVLQPENLKSTDFIDQLRALNPTLQVVVAFRMLPEAVWAMPALGTFNMHASLLPQYRGAAPINWAIINGEKTTGVTTFFLDKEIDTGRIILQKSVDISASETAGTLHDKLMNTGADIVVETLQKIIDGTAVAVDQDELIQQDQPLKKAPKIFREDCRINWNCSGIEICNLIRGLNPIPGAFTEVEIPSSEPLFMKIFEAIPQNEDHTLKPGTILTDNKNYIKISCSDGFIDVKMLQAAGKKSMKTAEFLRGYTFQGLMEIK